LSADSQSLIRAKSLEAFVGSTYGSQLTYQRSDGAIIFRWIIAQLRGNSKKRVKYWISLCLWIITIIIESAGQFRVRQSNDLNGFSVVRKLSVAVRENWFNEW